MDTSPRYVPANNDLFGEHRGLGVSSIDFKVSASNGGILVLENTFHAKGGPARHLHHEQDEWFYVLEGEFLFEVGHERFCFGQGDSLFVPRKVPHVWAYIGESQGKVLVTFTPAGRMEDFFLEVTKANAMPPENPELWREYGMKLLGPPLPVE